MIDVSDLTYYHESIKHRFNTDKEIVDIDAFCDEIEERLERNARETELKQQESKEKLHSEFCQMMAKAKFGEVERMPIVYPCRYIDKRCRQKASRIEID